MKKYLILFPVLVLMGAGCAKIQTEEPKQAEKETVNVETQGETTVTTDDGAEITFKTTEPETEDGVPIVDVVLGGATVKVNMEVSNFLFTPKIIEAKAGEKIRIDFVKNVGFHTFVIDELNLTHGIKEGEALTFNAPTKPGSYPFYCDIGTHRAQGLEGTLIVK